MGLGLRGPDLGLGLDNSCYFLFIYIYTIHLTWETLDSFLCSVSEAGTKTIQSKTSTTEHSIVCEKMVLWEALIFFISITLFIFGNFIFIILMRYYESITFINRNIVTYLSMYLICILITIILVAVIHYYH